MAEIFLTNTLSRKKEIFTPINENRVGIYSCGPTVYRNVHIGNLRTYLAADFLKRMLAYNGFEVFHVKNITDVGHMRTTGAETAFDPVIAEALKEGKTPLEIAENYTKLYVEDENTLNIIPADVNPKATEHVTEMVTMIEKLVENGLAYEVAGTIYFNVKKFADYGKLSGNTLSKMDQLLEAVRVSVETDKKDSADFALWKKAEPGRLMSWDSPWGKGFPGWHIECSAMSTKYLGEHFDIHTGGEDLVFPHHEDEIAQSEGATGAQFVNYWFHAGYLLVDNKKMARSAGNFYILEDITKRGFDPLAFRYLALTTHYKSRLNFTWESLEAAAMALNNLYRELSSYGKPADEGIKSYEEKFLSAINDDLDLPKALTVVQDLVSSHEAEDKKAASLLKFDEVLGLNFETFLNIGRIENAEVGQLVEQREAAREKKDWAESDRLREAIAQKGYEVVDDKEGTKLKKIIKQKLNKVISSSDDVENLLDKLDEFEYSVQILSYNSEKETKRLFESLFKNLPKAKTEIVFVDNGSIDTITAWVESQKTELETENLKLKTLRIDRNIGEAAARNVGLKQSLGKTVILIDSSVEVVGDIFKPVNEELADKKTGLVGKWGVNGDAQMQHFHEESKGNADAIELYFLAFRREDLRKLGLFDEKFRFYRHLDLDVSLNFLNSSFTNKVIELPLTKHQHLVWGKLDEKEADKLSKKNYYYFLEKWRDKKHLLLCNKN